MENNNINHLNFHLINDWFDITIDNKRIEVCPINHDNPVFIFEFDSGQLNVLSEKNGLKYFNSPTIVTQTDPLQVFYKFMCILRNRSEHYVGK